MFENTSFYETLWSNKYWFPKYMVGVAYGWSDLENELGSNIYYPKMCDLHWGIVLGAVLVVARYALETVLVIPLGYKLGIRRKRTVHVEPNPVLEKVYKTNKHVEGDICQNLSKQLDIPVRQIEIWFRKRKAKDASAPIKKFCENSWNLIFYTLSFIYGITVLWNKPWLMKTKACWDQWPKQHVTSDLYWYYLVELAFYWSLVFTLFVDHKRKDFKEFVCHHFATIVLIYFSWLVNFVRVGSLVLLLHDSSDPWLALAKMGIYLKKKTLTDNAFAIFVVAWILSRLTYFPFWILNSTLIEVFELITETFFVYYFFNTFLLILFVLHIMWSISIFKILYKSLVQGEVEDSRSDSEVGSDDLEYNEQDLANGHDKGNTNSVENNTTSDIRGPKDLTNGITVHSRKPDTRNGNGNIRENGNNGKTNGRI